MSSNSKKNWWTVKEENIIKENYPHMLMDEIAELLPKRTHKAINGRANKLKVVKSPNTLARIRSVFGEGQRGDKNHRYGNQYKRKEFPCQICGTIKPYDNRYVKDIESGARKTFCSSECSIEYSRTYVTNECLLRGEEHPRWKGGVKHITESMRSSISGWSGRVLEENGHVCGITGQEADDLVVHHLLPFFRLRDEVLSELDLPTYATSGEYTREEHLDISALIREKHHNEAGVPIRAALHKMFHDIYGFDVTPAQYADFKDAFLDVQLAHEHEMKEAITV